MTTNPYAGSTKKIPYDYIPIIVAHWLEDWFCGGGLDMRDLWQYLDNRGVFSKNHPEDVVDTWIKEAENWALLNEDRAEMRLDEFAETIEEI